MLKKLRLIVTGIVVLFIIAGISNLLGIADTNISMGILEQLGMLVFVIIMCMVLYLIIYYWYGKDYKCPSCNKRFCLKKEGNEIVNKEFSICACANKY